MAEGMKTGDDQSAASSPYSLGHAVIPIVNKLQDIFSQLGSSSTIDLPQVAVVGSQSSGKSSVLEALVGRDFLPRGSDICTRRPLVLQLVHLPRRPGSEVSEWGEFLHIPGKRFTDFSAIRREIQAETEKEAGINKGVSDKQIRLKVFSPNILNITLVDLPGITKVPVGDQPSDIEARIRTMILSYIKHETCIILAVTPANSDLANSDALQMARIADPDGSRTIGVITKLDIMDRGTDACNFLLGNVIPLRLGYIGVVNRSQEDITHNRTIAEALAFEENFFRNRPVYHSLSDRCGIPQLAKRLNQILVQHIIAVLPGLKARLNAQMVAVVKELSTYGEITESKAGQGALLLNILTKYTDAFSSMVEGKNEEMSTAELSGGARIHYIFQSIFVKSLEEVDPCEDLSDEEIRTAIQNATGPRNALFVPEVPFELLVKRQIARLLDPSLQCARFIYDELIKMSHRCHAAELKRFPVLMRRMEDAVQKFLHEGLVPAETMIGHLIEMEMDYINTSHHNFIGGSKAVEISMQQLKSTRLSANSMIKKDGTDSEKLLLSEKNQKSRAILARSVANGSTQDQGIRPIANNDRPPPAATSSSSWGISSIFGATEHRTTTKESSINKPYHGTAGVEHMASMIQLKEPPPVLRPSEAETEHETIEIAVTKLLLKSYYDIVRKSIQDLVPKSIMHFLVNHAKKDLHGVLIQKLYRWPAYSHTASENITLMSKIPDAKNHIFDRASTMSLFSSLLQNCKRDLGFIELLIENLFEEMLQEREEVATKRKQCRELLHVLQQAVWTLDELPLEAEMASKGPSSTMDATTGLPKIQGLPSFYSLSNGDISSYTSSPRNPRSRKSSHSGEQPSPLNSANGGGYQHAATGAGYPTIEI